MTQTLEATFDGQGLRLDEPLKLQPNTRVRITIETAVPQVKRTRSFCGRRAHSTSWDLRTGRRAWKHTSTGEKKMPKPIFLDTSFAIASRSW